MATTMTTQATRGRFVWHELMTKDPQAAQDFYTKVVGWTTAKFDGAGVDYTMWMSGEAPVGGVMALTPDAEAMGARPAWTAYIEVPDVDATLEQAVKLGGSVIVPADTVDQVGRFAVLADPQGAVFAVITSATPIAEETDPKQGEFSWHELNTTDDVAAVDFYNNLFGWEKQQEMDMGEMGMYRMFGRGRFMYGGMMKKPPSMEAPSHWLHYAQVDSADAAAERAKNAGGTILFGPDEVPGGDRIAVMMDPQGAAFAVHSKKPAA